MKKRVIVLDHGGGRLANQLWTDMAIYAYALDKNYEFESWASFEYQDYFNIPPVKNWLARLVFFNKLVMKIKGAFWRKWIMRRLFKKIIYRLFAGAVKAFNRNSLVEIGKENFFFSPSEFEKKEYTELLGKLDSSDAEKIYFYGYGFRNPGGLKKHHKEICDYLSPKDEVARKPEKTINELREKFSTVVGVHFRQGDYRTVPSHHIWRFTEEEVRKILDSYLSWSGKSSEETVFLITSDEEIDEEKFEGLNISVANGSEIEDLLTLSKTDVIIGSKSTYGDFAAYYGNIPFVVFERGGVEWGYYTGKTEYFENRKSHLNSELSIDQA